jgi:hypothetical protein
MRYFYDAALGQPLLAFAVAFYLVIILGGEIRRGHPALADAINSFSIHRKLRRNRLFRLISLGFISITVCFAFFPHIYHDMVPIRELKYPLYNLAGIILVLISFVRMLLWQVDMDKELHRHNLQGRQLSTATVMAHSKKMMRSYFSLFVGMTLILSNLASVALLLVAAIIYKRR